MGPDIERLIGEMHSDLKHINRKLDNLRCDENQPKITELYTWYTDNKEIARESKMLVIKSFVIAVVSSLLAVFGFKVSGV